MTTELSIVEPQALAHGEALIVADAAVAECFPVRSSGRLEISRAELYAINPQPGRSYESGPRTWRQEKTDGTNHYQWGSGIPSLSQGAGEKMVVSISDQVLAHLPAGRTLYLNE